MTKRASQDSSECSSCMIGFCLFKIIKSKSIVNYISVENTSSKNITSTIKMNIKSSEYFYFADKKNPGHCHYYSMCEENVKKPFILNLC